MKLDKRYSNGLTVTTAFTLSKAMDFQSGDDGGLDFYAGQGIQRNYARADFDRKYNFVQSYVYQLPIGPGKRFLNHGALGRVIGGWQVSGIMSRRSGSPLTFTGSNSLNLGSGGTATLDQIAPVQILGGINTGNPWFSIGSFAKAATNVQGNTGRNIMDGPGMFNLNASLSRTIGFRAEKVKLQLRLETLNVTNTAWFSNPNTSSIGSASFGIISSTVSSGTGVNGTGGGRVVQLGAKMTF